MCFEGERRNDVVWCGMKFGLSKEWLGLSRVVILSLAGCVASYVQRMQ